MLHLIFVSFGGVGQKRGLSETGITKLNTRKKPRHKVSNAMVSKS